MTPEDLEATPNADLRDENAKLRAEVERLMKMGPGHTCWATMGTAQKEALIEQRDKAYRELDAMKLQIDEIRKAWDMIDGWVGCETRSDPVADKEIQDGVEAMIKALNPRTNKPKCEHKRVVVNTFYNEAVSVSARKCADCGEAVSPPDALKRKCECQCHEAGVGFGVRCGCCQA